MEKSCSLSFSPSIPSMSLSHPPSSPISCCSREGREKADDLLISIGLYIFPAVRESTTVHIVDCKFLFCLGRLSLLKYYLSLSLRVVLAIPKHRIASHSSVLSFSASPRLRGCKCKTEMCTRKTDGTNDGRPCLLFLST